MVGVSMSPTSVATIRLIAVCDMNLFAIVSYPVVEYESVDDQGLHSRMPAASHCVSKSAPSDLAKPRSSAPLCRRQSSAQYLNRAGRAESDECGQGWLARSGTESTAC